MNISVLKNMDADFWGYMIVELDPFQPYTKSDDWEPQQYIDYLERLALGLTHLHHSLRGFRGRSLCDASLVNLVPEAKVYWGANGLRFLIFAGVVLSDPEDCFQPGFAERLLSARRTEEWEKASAVVDYLNYVNRRDGF